MGVLLKICCIFSEYPILRTSFLEHLLMAASESCEHIMTKYKFKKHLLQLLYLKPKRYDNYFILIQKNGEREREREKERYKEEKKIGFRFYYTKYVSNSANKD